MSYFTDVKTVFILLIIFNNFLQKFSTGCCYLFLTNTSIGFW